MWCFYLFTKQHRYLYLCTFTTYDVANVHRYVTSFLLKDINDII